MELMKITILPHFSAHINFLCFSESEENFAMGNILFCPLLFKLQNCEVNMGFGYFVLVLKYFFHNFLQWINI